MDIRICAYCCPYYSHEIGSCTLFRDKRVILCPFGMQVLDDIPVNDPDDQN